MLNVRWERLSVGEATARNYDPSRDRDFILAAALAFAAEAAPAFLPTDLNSVAEQIDRPDTCIGVTEVDGAPVGAVGFQFAPYGWNKALLVASELFWWVDPRHDRSGAALTLLGWAQIALRSSGAHVQNWSAMRSSPDSVHRIYARKGMVPLQIGYWGAI